MPLYAWITCPGSIWIQPLLNHRNGVECYRGNETKGMRHLRKSLWYKIHPINLPISGFSYFCSPWINSSPISFTCYQHSLFCVVLLPDLLTRYTTLTVEDQHLRFSTQSLHMELILQMSWSSHSWTFLLNLPQMSIIHHSLACVKHV